jgi:hypothetical protein
VKVSKDNQQDSQVNISEKETVPAFMTASDWVASV